MPNISNKIVISSNEVDSVDYHCAIISGLLGETFDQTVQDYGHCWDTLVDPDISKSKSSNGLYKGGGKTFTTQLTGLVAGKQYYVRAYFIIDDELVYSTAVSFHTVAYNVPTVTTAAISDITATTAKSGGEITHDGGTPVTACGVCWSTSPDPTIDDNKTSDGTDSGTFTSIISGFETDVVYYARAYVTNSIGTGYGNQVTFIYNRPSGIFRDVRDNHDYNWVLIGSKVWMAENLAYLPTVSPPSEGSDTIPYYYVYEYNDTSVSEAKATTNYLTYGVLYNWPAVMNLASFSNTNPSGVQGICPVGWHLPSDTEWTELTDFLGDESVVGGKLKEAGFNHWLSPNEGATNSSGFSALPGGYRSNSGNFYNLYGYGYWWSTTEYDASYAWNRYLYFNHADVYLYKYNKENGFSVRCIMD